MHLLEFRVVPGHEAEVVAFLRRCPMDDRLAHGLAAQCIGRRLGRSQQEFVLATVWRDETVFRAGIQDDGLPASLEPMIGLLEARNSSAFEVLATHWGEGFGAAKILRVYRATIAATVMDAWRSRAEEQAEQLSETTGLRVILAGSRLQAEKLVGDVPIMAVSAWLDWNSVLAATGGHIDRLVHDTELDGLEKPGSVDHYQLLDREDSASEAADAD